MLPWDDKLVEEVHPPPHRALLSRLLASHQGTGRVSGTHASDRFVRDDVGGINCRNLMASICGRQGVSQPPAGSRVARVPALFAPPRPPGMLPLRIHQLPGDAAVEPTIGGGGVTGRQWLRAWRPSRIRWGQCE